MYKILCNQMKNSLSFMSKNSRHISGPNPAFNAEMDPSLRKFMIWKRLLAFSFFGTTLITALVVKRRKGKQWNELMAKSMCLQGQKFGSNELFLINKNLVIAEPVLKIWTDIESFVFRETDILLTGFPKSGITWMQEIVWLIDNDLDYETAKTKSITDRFPYFEFPNPGIKSIKGLKDRRFIKTHLNPSLLFKDDISDKKDNNNRQTLPKMIAIFRNPKDIIVSYYHFCRMNQLIGYKLGFDDFFMRFIKGSVPYGPVWKHYLDVLDWNENHSEDNQILIIKFEDLKRDFINQINKICEFIGKPKLSEEELKQLELHCSFDQMKNNPSVNYKYWDDMGFRDKDESEFMRRGQIGDWRYYFTKEQNKVVDHMINEKLGTKIQFVYQ